MRKVAIIGSGIAGLVAAHGLRKAGFEVTLFSDRSPSDWLTKSRPTGTAARFERSLEYERELGLNHWDDVAPRGEGVYLTFCPVLHNRLVRLVGRFEKPFQAIDVRLQSARWMEDLEQRGGRVVIEPVDVERLDAIAAEHDLTIVAAGRGELCNLFARDDARSPHRAAQRKLAMVIAAGGPSRFNEVPLLPVRFDFLGTDGEIFFIPYHHKDLGTTWNILIEAKPGSRLDRFGALKNGDDAMAMVKTVVSELFPWDAAFVRDMRLADPLGWLVGEVVPMVRRPTATLPSGRVVAALGDTAISYDPIAAQGANSGVRQAQHLVQALVRRGSESLDAAWITATFEQFYAEHARHAMEFSNLLLEPLAPAGQELLIAQCGSDGRIGNESGPQRVANAFVENFNLPSSLTPALTDRTVAKASIASITGGRPFWYGLRGRAKIARGQIAQKLTRAPSAQA